MYFIPCCNLFSFPLDVAANLLSFYDRQFSSLAFVSNRLVKVSLQNTLLSLVPHQHWISWRHLGFSLKNIVFQTWLYYCLFLVPILFANKEGARHFLKDGKIWLIELKTPKLNVCSKIEKITFFKHLLLYSNRENPILMN